MFLDYHKIVIKIKLGINYLGLVGIGSGTSANRQAHCPGYLRDGSIGVSEKTHWQDDLGVEPPKGYLMEGWGGGGGESSLRKRDKDKINKTAKSSNLNS